MDGECQLHKDTKKKFNLGQVDFINCLPVNFPIENGDVQIDAEIIRGVPAELNKLILNNEIDIAPVSSVTYLENKGKLVSVGDLCIASNGPADSVLLFSKYPLDELSSANILLSSASATSNKLVQIIFREFLKIDAKFESSSLNISDFSARLLIGDHALLEFSKKPKDTFIYDLGSLWKKYTGLPMVFGMWVVRKELEKVISTLDIISTLQSALEAGLNLRLNEVINKAQSKILLSKEFYESYFRHLTYKFDENCKKGLELFEKYSKTLELITLR
jgi:chorismate dehydratase